MSVIDYQDPSACAKKIRKPGYMHKSHIGDTWIADESSKQCRHDRRMITPECVGCMRPSDVDYLKRAGLWIDGVSHEANK